MTMEQVAAAADAYMEQVTAAAMEQAAWEQATAAAMEQAALSALLE